jgi:hypothetical protein
VGAVLAFTAFPSSARTPNKIDLGEALGGMKIGGHVHSIATSRARDFQDDTSGDTSAIDVNSVELSLAASPLKAVDANVTWLMEEGFPDGGSPGQSFAVDQAYVVLSGNSRVLTKREERGDFDVSPWYAKIGKQYIPFGTEMEYHTFDVISEPQTLQMAETLESSVLLGYTPSETVNIYGGAFSGSGGDFEAGSAQDNEIDDYFLGLDVRHAFDGTISLQWMNNINNSIALTTEAGTSAEVVGGFSGYASTALGPVRLQLAHVRALDEYDNGGLVTSGAGQDQPAATTLEVSYAGLAQIMGRSVTGTLVYDSTEEWLDHPDQTWGAVVDATVFPGVTGSVEYLDRDYDRTYSGFLADERIISARLAVGFEDLFRGSNGR